MAKIDKDTDFAALERQAKAKQQKILSENPDLAKAWGITGDLETQTQADIVKEDVKDPRHLLRVQALNARATDEVYMQKLTANQTPPKPKSWLKVLLGWE